MSQRKQKTTPATSTREAMPLGTLSASFISKLIYEMQKDWQPGPKEVSATLDLRTTVEGPPNSGVREVTVYLGVRHDNDDHGAYQIEIEAVTVIGDLPADAPKEALDLHAIRVGAPIAYGLIRETLISLSARGPYPRIVLPLVPLTAFTSEATPPPP